MKLYVDEFPVSCRECRLRLLFDFGSDFWSKDKENTSGKIYSCAATGKQIRPMKQHEGREKYCPLLEFPK